MVCLTVTLITLSGTTEMAIHVRYMIFFLVVPSWHILRIITIGIGVDYPKEIWPDTPMRGTRRWTAQIATSATKLQPTLPHGENGVLVLPLVDQELEQFILLNFIILNLSNYNLVYEIEIILSYTSLKYSRSFLFQKRRDANKDKRRW